MIQRILIYVAMLLGLIGTCKWSPAAQTTLTDMPSLKVGNAINVIGTNVQGNTTKQNTMNTELYAHIAAGNPWVAQETAPSDTTKLWFDTNDQPGYVVLKIYTGGVWVAHKIGNDYTLPTASADTLGGVKVGSRLSIADGVLSADVQSTDISGKEDSLGNPSTTGYVLSSTTAGVRSWVANGSGSQTWPSTAGIAVYGGSSAWGSSLTLDTDLSTVSASDDSVPSAKATKAAIDALPFVDFGTGLTVAEDTPSAGTDTVSVSTALATWNGVTPGTGVATALAADIGSVGGLRRIVATGYSSLATAAISANTCSLQPFEATNVVAATDKLEAWITGRLSTVSGFGVTSAGALRIDVFLTDGYINFDVCNNTSASITPGALTIKWDVTR